MTNNYRPVSDRARAIHGEEDLELDLTPAEEQDALSGGHLEIVPRRYLVLVDNFSEGAQGSTYEGALPVDREAALISGGVLMRVQDEDAEPPADADDNDPDADAVPTDTKPAASKPVAKQKED